MDIWSGDDSTGHFNGLIPQLLLDATVIDVATPVAITSANVEAELAKFIDAVPDAVIGASDLVLGVSTNVLRALKKFKVLLHVLTEHLQTRANLILTVIL